MMDNSRPSALCAAIFAIASGFLHGMEKVSATDVRALRGATRDVELHSCGKMLPIPDE